MKNFLRKPVFLLCLLGAASISALAQTPPSSVEKPHDAKTIDNKVKNKSEKDNKVENKTVKPSVSVTTKAGNKVNTEDSFDFKHMSDEPLEEKAIETDAKVNIRSCVTAGDLIVRGWQRSEVRVLVTGGKVNFKVKQRSAENNKPEALEILGVMTKGMYGCLKAERIEIEAPYGATLQVESKSQTGDEGIWSFDSLAKVAAKNVNGDILLRNITREIEVSSLQGNLAAEDSSGKITLKTFGGNIAAFRLKPNDYSDTLKLGSASGIVIIRDVKHKIIEAGSTSGGVGIYNSLVRGGNYDFNTTNGSVTLQLPPDFPFHLRATLTGGSGKFQSDFPACKSAVATGQPRLIDCKNGADDTPINITSFDGVIHLKKK